MDLAGRGSRACARRSAGARSSRITLRPSLVERLAATLECPLRRARARRCRRAGTRSSACRRRPGQRSATTGCRSITISFRPLPCSGACSAARASNSIGRCSSASRCAAKASCPTSRCARRPPRISRSRRCAIVSSAGRRAGGGRGTGHHPHGADRRRHGDGRRRASRKPSEPRPAPTWQRAMTPDALTLFRFSALTFNSHRIHYDAPYAEGVEKLPGLVVQGKLIALQLLETVRRAAPEADPRQYAYRSARPLYAGASLHARRPSSARPAATRGCGRRTTRELWCRPPR